MASLAIAAGNRGWVLPSFPGVVESPFPEDGFYVLVVEDVEGGGTLAPYYAATASETTNEWVRDHGVVMHVRDDDTDLSGFWQDAKETLLEGGLLPGMIARNGSRTYKGEVPTSIDAMIAALERLEGGR